MKHLLIILGLLLVGSTTYGQITISNDSILDNAEFIGRYEVRVVDKNRSWWRLNVSIISNDLKNLYTWQYINEMEKAISMKLDSQSIYANRLVEFTYLLDESRLTPTQVGGLRLGEAGKAYNGAAALSIIGAVGGSALVLSGYPLVGSVITLSSGVIAFFVQITGNNKLIKGGKSLQKDK